MAEPVVSVLMAVRNGATTVAEAMDSILCQTLDDLEFIVIDDGSTDGTPDILENYGDVRISCLRNERSQGLAISLNRALERARGTFIARQDADDRSLPDRLEMQVEFLKAHPEVGILGTAYHVLDETGTRREIHRQPIDDRRIRWQMLFHNAFCHTSMMFRWSLFDDHNLHYDESMVYSQDYDLWARAMEVSQGANLDKPLVELRLHDSSVSATKRTSQQQFADQVSERQLAALMPDRPPSLKNVSVLRRCYYRGPESPEKDELTTCRTFLAALDAFVQLYPDAESFVSRDRCNWVERLIGNGCRNGIGRQLAIGFSLFPSAPVAVLRVIAKEVLNR